MSDCCYCEATSQFSLGPPSYVVDIQLHYCLHVVTMATGISSEIKNIVPLNASNYATWKVQIRMLLVKDNLWNIVNGTEVAPAETDSQHAKFVIRKDRALATIVLSIDPSLLYLIGDPDDPIVVWNKLADQFQKKTWANKLALRRKLYSLRLNEGDSVQEHIKVMTEIFNDLAVVGDAVEDEDRVVHLLASLPDSYGMLVTALEANAEVPKLEVVTERLLHEERKLKDREGCDKAMLTKSSKFRMGPKCHHCGKYGHIKRNCYELNQKSESKSESKPLQSKSFRQKVHKAEQKQKDSSDSESAGLFVYHMLSANTAGGTDSWIVDSGATCHMCNDEKLFVELHSLKQPMEVMLGDGHIIKAVGHGDIMLQMNTEPGKSKLCKVRDVMYVPKISYNLLSVSKASEFGNTTKFSRSGCQIFDVKHDLIATATRVGSLYYLNCHTDRHEANLSQQQSQMTKEHLWHKRYGHLGVQNLEKLATGKLVHGFDYDVSQDINFCEPCVSGKHHRSHFPTSITRSDELLGLVHSDVCGKMNAQSLSGAEYFVAFIDDKTRYVWTYVLKRKDQVFDCFLQWKAEVEKSTGAKLKVLRTDNGGEFTSTEFQKYLKSEGVRHELTVPKTPEQNGVAERMNRTLIETVRSMLADSQLPQKFWAEALSTAVYLRNRSPTRAVEGKTPFEAWTGQKPDVKNFRVFGCVAYAHIPKDERHKLDSKAKKCIFLGYGTNTKGYRLYDPQCNKVIHSRDVVFDELSPGVTSEPNVEDKKFPVELDNIPDEDEQDESTAVETTDQALRQSQRMKRPPDLYGEWATVSISESNEPRSVTEALASPDKIKWLNAMQKEIQSLNSNDVWDLVELPGDRKAVGSKWVFKLKVDADGLVERHKARLVAQGFSQKFGLDYDETFCPVVRHESIRTVIALAVQHGLKLHQLDITTAFLNGKLDEEVYMKQPEGFVTEGQEHLVCRLKRSIYGLKQSPRCWNAALDSQLKKLGFVQTSSDPCIYIAKEGEMCIIAVYVDDIILAAKSDERLAEVKKYLTDCFEVRDMGELHHFLGMKIVQFCETGDVWIGQPAYAGSILQKFSMDAAKGADTPVDANVKLMKAVDSDESVDQELYQSAVGSLLYLSVATRPDIAYAVSNVAKFSANPTRQHWNAVKRIMRYIKATLNYGLLYQKDWPENLVGYSDADWGGDLDDRKSTSGYLFMMSGAATSWRSKKQSSIALSTAEAEYMALASAAQEAIWMRQLTTELRSKPVGATEIYEDNQSTICMAKSPQFHGRSKHIGIKYHFIREQVENGTVFLRYCRSESMIADMLTKGLHRDQFIRLRNLAGIKMLTCEKEC